jgi:hypothetical protein
MKTYNLYINSKNRDLGEKTYDFNLYLKNQIMVDARQYINVDVCSFYMLNSMYNVSSVLGNNSIDIQIRNTTTNALISNMFITIPDGNYNVLTLRDHLNTALSNVIVVSYNQAQNTYTFRKIDPNFRYIFNNIRCRKMIGLNENTEITSQGITGNFLNMVDYQQIVIKTDLSYENLNQDNITDTQNDFNVSEILFWTNKQDVEPFGCISYQNEDAGDSFSYNIANTNIQKINFKVLNENNQIIADAPEWLMHIKFTVNEKYQSSFYEIGERIIKLLNDINYTLLNILFRKIMS